MESPRPKSPAEIVELFDDQTLECFATLGDILADMPDREKKFCVTFAAGGWQLSTVEAKRIILKLVREGLVFFYKTVAGEDYYIMDDQAAEFSRTLIESE